MSDHEYHEYHECSFCKLGWFQYKYRSQHRGTSRLMTYVTYVHHTNKEVPWFRNKKKLFIRKRLKSIDPACPGLGDGLRLRPMNARMPMTEARPGWGPSSAPIF